MRGVRKEERAEDAKEQRATRHAGGTPEKDDRQGSGWERRVTQASGLTGCSKVSLRRLEVFR
jgi:hypothetical protein